MPKHEEGYVSQRVDGLMISLHCRGRVLDVVTNLKESICGTSDAWGPRQFDLAAEILQFYLDHWVPNERISPNPMAIRMKQYDQAVKGMIEAALKIYEEWKRKERP